MAREGGKRVIDAVLKVLRQSQPVPPHGTRKVLPSSLLLANLSRDASAKALSTAQHCQELPHKIRKDYALNTSHRAAIAALCATAVTSLSLAYAAEDARDSSKEDATSSEPLPAEFLKELKVALGEDNVVLDSDERMSHAKPWNSYHPVKGVPGAVVYPK